LKVLKKTISDPETIRFDKKKPLGISVLQEMNNAKNLVHQIYFINFSSGSPTGCPEQQQLKNGFVSTGCRCTHSSV